MTLILGAGIGLWSLALTALFRLLTIARSKPPARHGLWLWLAVLAATGLLYFRPHENIFGGEDPGSYVNSAITYDRKGAFFFQDPLLSRVPWQARHLFMYGHAGYGLTKDACLWIHDVGAVIVGPHFQPAYPLMMGAVARVAPDFFVLWVIPLFALFTALALRSLAFQLSGSRFAGWAAMAFFLLNPLVLWHGRCARPELIAAFMALGGWALLIHAWKNPRWTTCLDIVLGALCLAAAPLFHITAWLVLIPAVLVVVVLIFSGRGDFLLCPLAALGPFAAFLYQLRHVTDYYQVGGLIANLPPYTPVGLGIVFLLLVLAAVRRKTAAIAPPFRTWTIAPPCGAAAAAAGLIALYLLRRDTGSLPLMLHYLYLTDVGAVVNMISGAIASLGLLGLGVFLCGFRTLQRERLIFCLAMLPALFIGGQTDNFMMTRYWLIALLPMLSLALTSLVLWVHERGGWWRGCSVGLALAILLLGFHNRSHLATLTEYRGWLSSLRPIAKTLQESRGLLLCEYSRIAASFDHFFGVPTLGLDNERHSDYALAEGAWADIVRKHPDQSAFFLTPFQEPRSDRFLFTPVQHTTFHGQTLQQARRELPTRIKEWDVDLHLYRMTLREPGQSDPRATFPCRLALDAGNMGWRNFSKMRARRYVVEGLPVSTDKPASLNPSAPDGIREGLLFFATETPPPATPMAPLLTAGRDRISPQAEWLPLGDSWWVYRISNVNALPAGPWTLSAPEPLVLSDALWIRKDGGVIVDEAIARPARVRQNVVIPARWARAEAQMLMPVPGSGQGLLLIFAYMPAVEKRPDRILDVLSDPFSKLASLGFPSDQWHWRAVPFRLPESGKSVHWLTLRSDLPWDSKVSGFPKDLGPLIGAVTVLP
ncbi:MAG: hypothetical protein HY343_02525 [Lentisphaerae bacterium]|nr:hypothetical protein [Lentisphaerota bacterium]